MPTAYKDKTPAQKTAAHLRKKAWAQENAEKTAAYRRTHYHANRDKYLNIERARSYAKLYGITLAEYDAMFAAQGGKCAICRSPESSKGGRFVHFCVDHCHQTGRVRGLLCIGCNRVLGAYEQRRDGIAAYLQKASQ